MSLFPAEDSRSPNMEETEAGTHQTPAQQNPRWLLPAIGSAIVALVVATNIGNALWAGWIKSHPLGLLAFNSTNKYLLGTSIYTAFWPYLAVATVRLMIADPLFYALGYRYRGQSLRWARRVFPGIDPIVDQFEADETFFKKLLNPLVLVAPNNPVCLLTGVAAMPLRRFFLLNFIGTVGRILLFRQIGFFFENQITSVVNLVARYQGWFIRGSIVIVIAYLAWQLIGNRGLLGGVEALEDELGSPEDDS